MNRSIGIYVGLVTILRGTAFHLQNRQLYIPTELLNKVHLCSTQKKKEYDVCMLVYCWS